MFRLCIAIVLWIILWSACDESGVEPGFIPEENTTYDLLIRGGKVWSEPQEEWRVVDVLIQADTIVHVGRVEPSELELKQMIDASGKVVCPGFIDTHAHGDPLNSPDFKNFLAMGVTTICLGQDGSSPATSDLRPWMDRVDSTGPGVNIAMFVGHGTLRRLSGVDYATQPTKEGLQRMRDLLQDALAAGCYGMTTGLEYTPGTYAGDQELIQLAKIVGQNDALLMSHMRNEDDAFIEVSLRELLRQGEYCNVQASHLKVVYGKGSERAEAILALLDSARQRTAYTVTADVYPYTASYTGIGIVFPHWAKAPNDYETVKRERRTELLDFLRQKIQDRNGPEATLFGTAPLAGKTLAQVSQEQELPYEEVLLNIGPEGASGAYFVMNEALQARLLQDPYVMICSDGSPSMHHPRGYGSFPKIIETYVQEQQLISLAEAIRKMTYLPAQTLGIQDRGTLSPGSYADVLVFDPAAVRARATFSDPHQLATGMDWVIVNGRIAWQDDRMMGKYGRVLRKEQ